MKELIDRDYRPASSEKILFPRVRPVEFGNSLVVPDKTFEINDLNRIFGQDVEALTKLKLTKLGYTASDENEAKMLKFLNNPLIHKYPTGDSPAKYFMEIIFGLDGVLASYLPPNSKTHKHPHSVIHELYIPICGEAELIIDGEPHRLSSDKKMGKQVMAVPLYAMHPLETKESPAFTLIIMKNAALLPRKDWHK